MRYGGQAGPYAQTPTRRPGGQSPKRTEDTSNTTKNPVGFRWVARFLRTQQCARPPVARFRDGFPGPVRDGQYSHPDADHDDRIASAPPMSKPTRETFARGVGHGPSLPQRSRGRASQ
jgi:hypothetical protein